MQEGFLLGGVAVGYDVADVVGEGGEVLVGEWFGLVFGFGEFGAAGVEAGELLGEGGDAWGARLLGHGAGLEGAEVAVEGLVYLAQLGLDALQLLLVLRSLFLQLGEGVVDGGADDRFLLQDGEELAHDRLFEFVGGEAVVVAGFGAVALAGVADVVGVAA
ncbi:MAG TPA: hypothetical protein VGL78_06145, partial [Solirubrobacteraceae bacterium]